MRFGIRNDALRRPVFYKGFQHKTVPVFFILYAGSKLPIAEGASSSFAELYVAFPVQLPALPELINLPGPYIHIGAPFKNYRVKAGIGKIKSCKHPGRSEANNNR